MKRCRCSRSFVFKPEKVTHVRSLVDLNPHKGQSRMLMVEMVNTLKHIASLHQVSGLIQGTVKQKDIVVSSSLGALDEIRHDQSEKYYIYYKVIFFLTT